MYMLVNVSYDHYVTVHFASIRCPVKLNVGWITTPHFLTFGSQNLCGGGGVVIEC